MAENKHPDLYVTIPTHINSAFSMHKFVMELAEAHNALVKAYLDLPKQPIPVNPPYQSIPVNPPYQSIPVSNIKPFDPNDLGSVGIRASRMVHTRIQEDLARPATIEEAMSDLAKTKAPAMSPSKAECGCPMVEQYDGEWRIFHTIQCNDDLIVFKEIAAMERRQLVSVEANPKPATVDTLMEIPWWMLDGAILSDLTTFVTSPSKFRSPQDRLSFLKQWKLYCRCVAPRPVISLDAVTCGDCKRVIIEEERD